MGCFVRKRGVQGVAIRVRVDRNGSQLHLLAGADDANGDFAAIGDQDFSYQMQTTVRRSISLWVGNIHRMRQDVKNHPKGTIAAENYSTLTVAMTV